jgi:hypothetical protein
VAGGGPELGGAAGGEDALAGDLAVVGELGECSVDGNRFGSRGAAGSSDGSSHHQGRPIEAARLLEASPLAYG